jgi:hypothetical protein
MLVPVTASGHPGSIRSLLLFLPLLYFIFLLHDHDHDAAAPFTRQPRPRREHDATTATTTADTAALAKQDAPYYPHYDCYPDYHRRRHNQHYLTTYATHPRRTQGARSQHAETERSRQTEATRSDQALLKGIRAPPITPPEIRQSRTPEATYMNLLPANGSPTDRGLLTHRTHRQPDPGYK